MTAWQYFHQHLQDNVLASIVVGVVAWFWKIKPHLQKIHQHNEYIRLKTEQIHKHVKEINNGTKRSNHHKK